MRRKAFRSRGCVRKTAFVELHGGGGVRPAQVSEQPTSRPLIGNGAQNCPNGYTVRMTQERRRTNTIGYWAIFAACQGLWGVALLLAANVHGTNVVMEISSWLLLVGWLLLLPGALLTAKLTTLVIPTVAIYLLRVAANLIVWYVIGTKLRVSSRPK